MKEKVTIMAAKPQFIRLSDGSLMNINNIVAISEKDSKVFVSAYQRIPITKEDMADVLENIEIIDDDEQPHHCGQDADMDDACCQARNYNQPKGYTYKDLLGMEVIGIGGMASHCTHCSDDVDCVKVELVGGDYICLAEPEQEESTTEIDDSPKSFEETYRDSMNLLREFCIKQSETNRRLVNALKEESEALKKPVIGFDGDE